MARRTPGHGGAAGRAAFSSSGASRCLTCPPASPTCPGAAARLAQRPSSRPGAGRRRSARPPAGIIFVKIDPDVREDTTTGRLLLHALQRRAGATPPSRFSSRIRRRRICAPVRRCWQGMKEQVALQRAPGRSGITVRAKAWRTARLLRAFLRRDGRAMVLDAPEGYYRTTGSVSWARRAAANPAGGASPARAPDDAAGGGTLLAALRTRRGGTLWRQQQPPATRHAQLSLQWVAVQWALAQAARPTTQVGAPTDLDDADSDAAGEFGNSSRVWRRVPAARRAMGDLARRLPGADRSLPHPGGDAAPAVETRHRVSQKLGVSRTLRRRNVRPPDAARHLHHSPRRHALRRRYRTKDGITFDRQCIAAARRRNAVQEARRHSVIEQIVAVVERHVGSDAGTDQPRVAAKILALGRRRRT